MKYPISKCANSLLASLEVVLKFKKAGQSEKYWTNQVAKWSKRLIENIPSQTFTPAEASALFDAANQMSDDFRDYYSFMGKKKCEAHANNYASAMEKLKSMI
jgi:hypothetical protein